MGILHRFEHILTRLPEVERPRYALTFKEKLKWVGLILVIYFILSETPLYGLDPRSVDIFENMRAVLAGSFGSIISLGIGPIVTASIILQILVGGKLLDIDLSNPRDKILYQGAQKTLAILFTIFEAVVMVFMGALPPLEGDPNLALLLILQISFGGILIIFMDEVVSKWGFGSGIGLFIVGGVSAEIIIGSFNPMPAFVGELPAGKIPAFLIALTQGRSDPLTLIPILGTLIVFVTVVYAESVKVEIPLTYGRFRGARGRYPLKFIYASVIPVIFASILMANVQLWTRMLQKTGYPILGTISPSGQMSGLVEYFTRPNPIYRPDFDPFKALIYTLLIVILAMLFSKFWVETTGMDSKTVAKKLQSGGMQIPGFRGDIRIIERVLDRYIPALTLLGGAAVGLLSAFGDLTGALGGGTGVLLAVGILYRLYEEMAKEKVFELNPLLKRVAGDIF